MFFLKANVIAPFNRFGPYLNVGDRQMTSDKLAKQFFQMSSAKYDQLGIAVPLKPGKLVPYDLIDRRGLNSSSSNCLRPSIYELWHGLRREMALSTLCRLS